MRRVYIGCAGWSLPSAHAVEFPVEGTHLQRYAARFRGVEINTSFYRPHRPATYARWAASVPTGFRFAVKAPKAITHTARLHDVAALLDRFLGEVTALGPALGPLLVQLPPGLVFDAGLADTFFALLRERFGGHVVCEPRNVSWFTPEAEQLLVTWQIARVAADPALMPAAAIPGGWRGLVYYRLHGSPRMYYSAYGEAYVARLAESMRRGAPGADVWCIFDNTAEGAATADALLLQQRLGISSSI